MSIPTILKESYSVSTKKERFLVVVFVLTVVLIMATQTAIAIYEKSELVPVSGGTYKEGIIGQPVFLNPVISANQADLDISALIYSSLFDMVDFINTREEGRVYSVKLKEGLKWDDGEPLTSDDVLFTIKTIQNPETNSHYRKNWNGISLERISELQIEFTLPTTPYVFFEDSLRKLPIIPEHIFEGIPPANLRLSNYNLEPVGSGPFKLREISRQRNGFITSVKLSVNEKYHGKKPFIKEIEFHFYQNLEDLKRAVERREIHGYFSSSPDDSDLLKEIFSRTIEIPALRYYTVFFNQNISSQFRNINLRRVLASSIKKDRIEKEISGASLISGPVLWDKITSPEGGVMREPLEHDIESSRDIINNLKGDGAWEMFLVVPELDFLVKTAEIIKESWEEIGIDKVHIMPVETNYLLENVIRTRNYEALLFGNIFINPYDLFAFWHSSQRFHPGLNLFLYQNIAVDRKLEDVRQAESEEERLKILKEIDELIINEQPAIFLYSLPYKYLQTNHLKGLKINTMSLSSERFLGIENWYIKEARVIKNEEEKNAE